MSTVGIVLALMLWLVPAPVVDGDAGRGVVLVMEAGESSGSLAVVDVDAGEFRRLSVAGTADGSADPFDWEIAATGVVVVTSDGQVIVVGPDGGVIDLGVVPGPNVSLTVSDDGWFAVVGRFLIDLATGSWIDLAEAVHPAFADLDLNLGSAPRISGGWLSAPTMSGWLFASVESPHRTLLVDAAPRPIPSVRADGTIAWGEDRAAGSVVLVDNLNSAGSTLPGRVIFESADGALPLGWFGDDVVVAEAGGPTFVVDPDTGERRDVTTPFELGDFIPFAFVRGGPFYVVEVNVGSTERRAVALNLETGELADLAGESVLANGRSWLLWGEQRSAAMTAMNPAEASLVDIDLGRYEVNWNVRDLEGDTAFLASCGSPVSLVVNVRSGSITESGPACLGALSPDGETVAYSTSFPNHNIALTAEHCSEPLIVEELDTGERHEFPDGGCPLTWLPTH